ncbi:PAAR domain-containing protein [Pseudoduganella chitinolytica]|uniref:PAAR domain-containing protein n=1 Tax=Pseudoduganella chitinolytica TaxID=34070 RepID=A0ABY8BEE0_9BURK|nr:PAAR domain-containing protein [Pseudoduganella chitinolytica]WEF34265.1 PAAR domain-containing protein [Pseudoduganella chitinolytica]
MPAAARLTDPIGHSPTMSWLLKGLLIGAAIAVAGVAIVGTGGLAAVAIVGAGAAMGAGLGEAMSTMSFAAKEVTGGIALAGSSNVFVNGLAAARAHVDMVACSKHPGPIPIATGSGQVFINSMPAARVDDKTGCSAVITKGSGNVYIGGGTVQTDDIHPEDLVPGWVHASLLVVGVGSAIILAGPVIAVGSLIGAFAGGYGGSWAGGKIFGEGSDGQKWSAIAGSFLGGYLGAKAAPGAWNFAQRVQVTVQPGTLGMNGGNLKFSLKPKSSSEPTSAELPRQSSRPEWLRRLDEGNDFNAERASEYPYNEVYIDSPKGSGYTRLDSYNPIAGEIVSRKFTQLSDIQEKTAIGYINEIGAKYPVDATIARVPSSAELAGEKLAGQHYLEVPVQVRPVPQSVLEAAERAGVVIRDVNGKIY